MESSPLSGEARAASWRVFALVLLSASYFFQSSGHNEAARFDQMRSVTEHGEWWIDRFARNTGDTIRLDGHTYPNKAPGTTLLGLAPWRVARLAIGLVPIDEGKQLILVTYALTILMSALPTALTSLLILRFLARNGWTSVQATLSAVGYGIGTIAFPWSTVFFGHQLSASFAFGAFYLIWSSPGLSDRPRIARLIAAGLLLGFLPVIEYPGALASGLIGLYALLVLGPKGVLPLVAGGAIGALPLPLYNQFVLGNAWSLSYSFYRDGSAFPVHHRGIGGVSWPRLDVLSEITFGSQRGLFHANPWLALAFLSPFFARRVRGLGRELALCAVIFAAFMLFNSGFGDSIIYWGGAFSFGPRHILISLPFVVLLGAVPMKSRFLKPIAGALIVLTCLLMLPAAAIDPRLPYEPREPFLDFYLPLYMRGLSSTYPWATFGDSTIFGSAGAFNLGRAASLPPDLQVFPLALVWAGATFALFRVETRAGHMARVLAASAALAVGLAPAWPRLESRGARQTGVCQAISTGSRWPYFSDYALQAEPSDKPVFLRAPSPSIPLTDEATFLASGSLASVAVTFSGHFTPEITGWYVLRVDTIGQAALYLDGLRRLKTDGGGEVQEAQAVRVYLSHAPHELILRYMSERPVRQLSVSLARGNGTAAPLVTGLSSGTCG
ncbi:MAG: hypothetical protein ABI565_03805 [Vicinamibacteria bacterium]